MSFEGFYVASKPGWTCHVGDSQSKLFDRFWDMPVLIDIGCNSFRCVFPSDLFTPVSPFPTKANLGSPAR